MKRYAIILATVLLLLTVTCLTATAQAKYCLSYDDYVNNQWLPLQTLNIEKRSQSQKFWSGGNDFTLTVGDAAQNRMLKKEAFLVMLGDSLFVNCRKLQREKALFGKGYARAFRYDGNKLCMINIRWGADKQSDAIGATLMFGIVGASLKTSSILKDRVCYLIDGFSADGKRLEATLMDDDFMGDLLLMDDELYAKYLSVKDPKERTSAANILPFLVEKGLIK